MRYQVVVQESTSDAVMVPLNFQTEEIPGKPHLIPFQSDVLELIGEMLVVARYFYPKVAVIDTAISRVINYL